MTLMESKEPADERVVQYSTEPVQINELEDHNTSGSDFQNNSAPTTESEEPIQKQVVWSTITGMEYRKGSADPAVMIYSEKATEAVASSSKGIGWEKVFWIFWTVTTLLWVIDRFTTNLWTRESFGKVDGVGFGSDPMAFKGEWSVQVYTFFSRATARITITALNGTFFTMCPVFFNWLREHQTTINLDDWQEANQRIHRKIGIILVVATILHVWLVILPAIFSGYSMVVVGPEDTKLQLPLHEWKPCKTVDVTKKEICFATDQLGRFVGYPVLFGVLLPVSLWGAVRRANFSMAMLLHIVIAVLYTIDMYRRRTHPHSWVLNTPVILLYIFDIIASKTFYRSHACRIVKTVPIDEDYTLVLWERPEKVHHVPAMVGDVYYLKSCDPGTGGFFERSHPFTTLNNHQFRIGVPSEETKQPAWTGHKFSVGEEGITRKSTERDLVKARLDTAPYGEQSPMGSAGPKWDTAAIVKVSSGRRCCVGSSHTAALASPHSGEAMFQGPYRSAYSRLNDAPHTPPLLLIGSGSGGAYLMDFVAFVLQCRVSLVNPVFIYYTTSSVALFQFVTDHLCAVPIANLQVNGCLTRQEGVSYQPTHTEREMQLGRLDLGDIMPALPRCTEVYFCGNPALQEKIGDECQKHELIFHSGHAF